MSDKGKWIDKDGWVHCSECNGAALFDDIYETPVKSPYCPWCGAKMELDVNKTVAQYALPIIDFNDKRSDK